MSGYKTYIIAAVTALYGITGLITGNLDANAAFLVIMGAAGAAGLRHGIEAKK